ncbi:hypothetical protein WJX73_010381 [Symbiochloris irregularis]|uniref:Serine protease n=1 Tax=Symbiochloris irregularis TaxID=706552 RepID=A0AAW1Q186_9CHLO
MLLDRIEATGLRECSEPTFKVSPQRCGLRTPPWQHNHSAVAVSAPAPPHLQQGAAPEDDESLGYTYEGKVEFVSGVPRQIPKVKLSAQEQPVKPAEHKTILIKRDGSKYTKRLPVHSSEDAVQQAKTTAFPGRLPEQPEAWEDSDPSTPRNVTRRKLAQSGLVVASTSTDLSCIGCPTSDVRVQVTATTTYPYSALGQLLGQLPSSQTQYLECSGTLIGTRHVVTAGHCVYDINDSHQYVDSLDFSPGLNGNNAPFGTLAWTTVRVLDQFTSQPSYTSQAMDYDFALVTLADPASSGTGYLAMFNPPNSGTQDVDITTAGYPGEKPSGTMWRSNCTNVPFVYSGSGPPAFANIAQCSNDGCGNIVNHDCLSSDGQSGSGMWDPSYTLRSILTGKVATSDGSNYNVGTMIDPFVYNTIAQWYNEDGGDNGNTTLPLAPQTGTPGSNSNSNNGIKNISISTPWVVAIIAAGGGLLLLALAAWIWTCFRRRRAPVVKRPVQQGPTVTGKQRVAHETDVRVMLDSRTTSRLAAFRASPKHRPLAKEPSSCHRRLQAFARTHCAGAPQQQAQAAGGACEGDIKVRKGKSLFSSGKECHLVLLGHYFYCYPGRDGSSKPPFNELDLSRNAHLSVTNSTTFTVKDQTWTTYTFQAATTEERNTWLSALRLVPGLHLALRDFYKVGRLLGRGMAGKVYQCTDLLSNENYAVKEGLAHPLDDFNGQHGLLNELTIMRKLAEHPHRTLPKLQDAFRTKDGMVQIVEELMTGNNICTHLAQNESYTEANARDVFREIAEGVAHLHSLGISHRDLKPENIFYKDKSPSAQIMILDFNLAKAAALPNWGAQTPCGTSPYMAPEVLQHRTYNQEVDMWALGCILHILLCGKVPFTSLNSAIQDRKVMDGDWDTDSKDWDCVSDSAKDLLGQLLEQNPQDRCTARQCLEHPWLNPGSASRHTLQQAISLESPAVLRKLQSGVSSGHAEGSSPTSNGWLRSVVPRGSSPGRGGMREVTSFASLNEALDADLDVMRRSDGAGRPSLLRQPSSENGGSPTAGGGSGGFRYRTSAEGGSPTAPHHRQYGSPGRQSMIDDIKEQLELANGGGLQDKHFGTH